MLTHPTLDQLHQLGLAGMARAFEELQANPRGGELAPAEWLGLLLDREIAERQDRLLKARLRFAKLRHQASVEDIDWRAARGLDRALFQKLAQGGWIEARENLILEARPGSGSLGWPAPSARRPAATTTPCSTSASRVCSPIWRWRAVTVVTPG